MRINLDEPVPDDPDLRIAATTDDETDEDADVPDGFVIRRDPLAQRRRCRGPRPLTATELRLITIGLILVIGIAGVSLTLYLLNVRRNADRLPISAINRSLPAPPPRQQQQGSMPWGGYRGPIARPPDEVTQPPPGPADNDETPTDGIH